MPELSSGQTPVLGSTAGFELFSTIGAVTNTGPSQIRGDVGTNNGSVAGFGNINGNIHDIDATSALAASDLLALYTQLDTATALFVLPSIIGNGDTLNGGVYQIITAGSLNGNLILNGQGNTNSVFIIQIQGPFTANTSSRIVLVNGAAPKNVFWKVEGLVTLSPGTVIKGTVVANNAGSMPMPGIRWKEGYSRFPVL